MLASVLSFSTVFMSKESTRNIKSGEYNKKEVFKLYNMISKNNIKETSKFKNMLPVYVNDVIRSVVKTFEFCKCYTSVEEADEEIIEYASKHNCFAILARDSDFIISEGSCHYLSMKHFNIANLTTKTYNKKIFAEKLGIDLLQLPLLATLAGNDIITADSLSKFHRDISKDKSKNDLVPFEQIADYIKKELPIGKEDILHSLPNLSKKVFDDHHYVEKLKLSLSRYWLKPDKSQPDDPDNNNNNNSTHWDQILSLAKQRHINCTAQSDVYAVLTNQDVYLGVSYEDLRDKSVIARTTALESMRSRIYGLLLKEKPGIANQNVFVREWFVNIKNTKYTVHNTLIILPDKHPGLLKLWDENDKTADTQNARWEVFCKAISSKLNCEEVRKLKSDLIVPVLALFYLKNEYQFSILKDNEIKALLAQAIRVNKLTSEGTRAYTFETNHCDPRTVYVSSLFQWTCNYINMLSGICGYPVSISDGLVARFFHGKIFHSMYYKCNEFPAKELTGLGKSEIDTFLLGLTMICNPQKKR